MENIKLIKAVSVDNTLGEGVVWNAEDNAVWWTDIQECKLYRYQPDNDVLNSWKLPERLGSFTFTNKKDWLICAFAGGFALYNIKSSKLKWLAKPDSDLIHTRFNDGKIDRQGRFWAGTMVEGGDTSESGSLYCLYDDSTCSKKETGISISNSLCWSPDSRKMYFADSPLHTIYQYDFNPGNGEIENKSIFATTPDNINPDGSTIDAEGYLWNAQWGGSQIVRYAANGKPDNVFQMPCSQPTCCTFGGRDLSYLFVTSAREGLSTSQLNKEPGAGSLFIFETPFQGMADTQFQIEDTILY